MQVISDIEMMLNFSIMVWDWVFHVLFHILYVSATPRRCFIQSRQLCHSSQNLKSIYHWNIAILACVLLGYYFLSFGQFHFAIAHIIQGYVFSQSSANLAQQKPSRPSRGYGASEEAACKGIRSAQWHGYQILGFPMEKYL